MARRAERCTYPDQDLLRDRREALRRVGVVTRGRCPEPLGCGVYGCAFASFGRRRGVVKVDRFDQSEAQFALWIRSLGADRPEALPNFFGAWRADGAIVVHREDLVDVPYDRYSGLDRLVGNLRGILENPVYFAARFYDLVGKGLDAAHVEQSRTLRRNVDVMRALAEWCGERDVSIRDLHMSNWGWRESLGVLRPFVGDGVLVVRDLGVAAVPRGSDVDLPSLGASVRGGPIRLVALRGGGALRRDK